MYLLGGDKVFTAQRFFYSFPVCRDILGSIAKTEGNILRVPWCRADATLALENSMKKHGRYKSRKSEQVIVWLHPFMITHIHSGPEDMILGFCRGGKGWCHAASWHHPVWDNRQWHAGPLILCG